MDLCHLRPRLAEEHADRYAAAILADGQVLYVTWVPPAERSAFGKRRRRAGHDALVIPQLGADDAVVTTMPEGHRLDPADLREWLVLAFLVRPAAPGHIAASKGWRVPSPESPSGTSDDDAHDPRLGTVGVSIDQAVWAAKALGCYRHAGDGCHWLDLPPMGTPLWRKLEVALKLKAPGWRRPPARAA